MAIVASAGIPWVQVLLTGVAAALLTQVAAACKEAIQGWRKDRKQFKLEAFQLAICLKRYALDCATMVCKASDAAHEARRDQSYEPFFKITAPKLILPESSTSSIVENDPNLATRATSPRFQ